MDETIETLMIGVRADTASFAQDTATMQASLQNSLGQGADKVGSLIESSLAKAVTSGKLGFADLEKSVLAVFGTIAAQTVSDGLSSLLTGMAGGGGLATLGSSLIGALIGSPGRATGGPVSPGRPYMVGEQGPEVFVPGAAGSIAPAGGAPAAGTGRGALRCHARSRIGARPNRVATGRLARAALSSSALGPVGTRTVPQPPRRIARSETNARRRARIARPSAYSATPPA